MYCSFRIVFAIATTSWIGNIDPTFVIAFRVLVPWILLFLRGGLVFGLWPSGCGRRLLLLHLRNRGVPHSFAGD